MPALVAILALMLRRLGDEPWLGVPMDEVVFLGIAYYAALVPANALTNSFAWDGPAAATYFLYPGPARRLILGRNLGVWTYAAILAAETVVTFTLVAGWPGSTVVASGSGILVLASGILALTIPGNFTSAAYPASRPISSVTSSPSQIAGVVTVLATIVGASLVSLPVLITAGAASPFARPTAIAVLLVALLAAYRATLGPVAELTCDRRERLLAELS
jgi:hypothetical protein